MNTTFIKDTVFETVDFNYDGKIEFGEFDGVKVEYDGKTARLSANTKPSLARACFLFAMNVSEGKKSFSIEEKTRFQELGVMLDCSRGSVMTVEAVKKYINCIVALGMNTLMLYTEDTYEIEGKPLFGYLRGRYTKTELKEIDAYADSLGVELIPCIQTLGHMEQYLKWGRPGAPDYTGEYITKIRDTGKVLLAESEDTYNFIEEEIKTCRECFKSKRIHIGMDEANDLGNGQYKKLHGEKNRTEIMLTHLNVVVKICEKYGFKPMMWSDMFFRLKTGTYYRHDFTFEKEIGENIPDVELVYWDYYHNDKTFYDNMFLRHKELGKDIVFAGAITISRGLLPIFDVSLENSVAAIKSCLDNDIKTVLVTLWGNLGMDTNHFFANSLLPVYSEYCYKGEECDMEDIKRASEFLTKIKFEDYKKFGQFSFNKKDFVFHGHRLFFDDSLYDLGIRENSCDEVLQRYSESFRRMEELMNIGDKNELTYRYAYLIFKFCYIKADLRKNLRNSYQNGNKAYLEKALNEHLPEMKKLLTEFKKVHKEQWYKTYKPFGFEMPSFRYGGMLSRIDDAMETLSDYLSGKTESIPELAERIYINEEDYHAPTQTLITPFGEI